MAPSTPINITTNTHTHTMTTETPQAALAAIQQKLQARKDKHNAFGGYSYRNKEGILEAVKPHLAPYQATITIVEELLNLGDRYYIKATATFTVPQGSISSTAFAREANQKKGMDEAQITGATSSYAGKYALCNLLAIDDSTVDPDATNDHDKRLPSLDEVAEILTAPTTDALNAVYKALIKRNVAKGYLTDLCRARKGQIEGSTTAPNATASTLKLD